MKLKGIDGGPHKRWSMWFNSTIHEEPYPGLTFIWTGVEIRLPLWPVNRCCMVVVSSFVRCWVKSRNERNPYLLLLAGNAEHSGGTAGDKLEEGRDDVKSAWPLRPGLHTCYNGRYKGLQNRKVKQISENRSQFGLQSATRLHEAGIASNRGSAKPR